MSLQGEDKTSFIVDAHLNEARNFLKNLVETNSVPQTRKIALKSLLMLGILRASSEDILTAATLLEA